MALEGSLRDFDLFSLFNMIKTQGKSGTLVLSRSQEFVKIFFDQGEIVSCDSNQVRMEDRVGAMLVRLGRLSGDELLAMVERQRQTLKRMGTLLLESGKITPQDLQDALLNQAMSILYRTFRWMEGDYRFDSILPLELDREHFPPLSVDTVLMEAARIMDEWPEVQRRLPDATLSLAKTQAARDLRLDIDQDLSGLLDGGGLVAAAGSGLSHEQETTLTYFSAPSSIQNVLQISRYGELETSKVIADLLGMGLLQVSGEAQQNRLPFWAQPLEKPQETPASFAPSRLLWPAVVLLLAGSLLGYGTQARPCLNQGLASLRRSAWRVAVDAETRNRKDWALRMASHGDAGDPENAMGIALDQAKNPIPDFTRYPDPLRMP